MSKPKTKLDVAYALGRFSYIVGDPRTSNPYRPNDEAFRWLDGWNSGLKDRLRPVEDDRLFEEITSKFSKYSKSEVFPWKQSHYVLT